MWSHDSTFLRSQNVPLWMAVQPFLGTKEVKSKNGYTASYSGTFYYNMRWIAPKLTSGIRFLRRAKKFCSLTNGLLQRSFHSLQIKVGQKQWGGTLLLNSETSNLIMSGPKTDVSKIIWANMRRHRNVFKLKKRMKKLLALMYQRIIRFFRLTR